MLLNAPSASVSHPGDPQTSPPRLVVTAIVIDPETLFTSGLAPQVSESLGLRLAGAADQLEPGLTLIRQLRPRVVLLAARIFEEGFRALCDELSVRLEQTILGVFADEMSDSRMEHAIATRVRGLFSKRCSRDELCRGVSQVASGAFYVAPPLQERVHWERPAQAPTFPSQSRIQALTDRQLQVLMHLAEGATVREIAGRTSLSEKAIESHKFRIMSRLGIKNRVQLSRWAIREGLIHA